jgi:hypothetical protein
MKTTLFKSLLGLFIALNTTLVSAQAWVPVGEMNIFPNTIPVLAIDSNDTPYILYDVDYQTCFLKRFKNNAWELVGEEGMEILPGNFKSYTLVIDNNDVPYIAYVNTDGKAVVKKFENDQWQTVGGEIVSPEPARSISLAFDNNNIPYVSYYVYNGTEITVIKRLEEGTWQAFGEEINVYLATQTQIVFDSTNILYIAYSGFTGMFGTLNIWVKKFEDNSWQSVGPNILLFQTNLFNIDFGLDSNNTPYIAYNGSNSAVIIQKFEADEWQEVRVVLGANTFLGAFSIDTDDNLYLSTSTSFEPQIQKFENNSWQDIGEIDEIFVGTYEMVFDSSNLPYCIFYVVDGASYTASVMKFDPTAGLETSVFNEVKMYPNPTSGLLYIETSQEFQSYEVYNLIGQRLLSGSFTGSIDMKDISKGTYIIRLTTPNGEVFTEKVIKE